MTAESLSRADRRGRRFAGVFDEPGSDSRSALAFFDDPDRRRRTEEADDPGRRGDEVVVATTDARHLGRDVAARARHEID